jgi:hypothetical protein
VPRCNAKEPVGRTAHASDNEPRRRSQHGQNEHAMALGRKSWLSERGAERAALMCTLIQTAKLNAIDPQAWLANVLARIADTLQTRLAELLSWNWRPELSRQKTA